MQPKDRGLKDVSNKGPATTCSQCTSLTVTSLLCNRCRWCFLTSKLGRTWLQNPYRYLEGQKWSHAVQVYLLGFWILWTLCSIPFNQYVSLPDFWLRHWPWALWTRPRIGLKEADRCIADLWLICKCSLADSLQYHSDIPTKLPSNSKLWVVLQ